MVENAHSIFFLVSCKNNHVSFVLSMAIVIQIFLMQMPKAWMPIELVTEVIYTLIMLGQ